MGLGLTPDVVRLCREHIEAGAREAGRRVEDIDVWWLVKSNVAESRAAAVEPIKMALAASANHAFRFTLEGKGLGEDLHEQVRGLRKEYEPHHHEVLGATPNAGLTDRWGSPTISPTASPSPARRRNAQRACAARPAPAPPSFCSRVRPRAAPVHRALGTGSGAAGRRGGRSPMNLISERMTIEEYEEAIEQFYARGLD